MQSETERIEFERMLTQGIHFDTNRIQREVDSIPMKGKVSTLPVPIPKAVETTNLDELHDPKKLRNLPPKYEVVFDDPETAGKMHEFARKLGAKHPNWSKERLMRKCFEEYPSTRIRIN
jgi:hypothetical protein